MNFIIVFIVSFLVVYLAYLITVISNKKKLEKFKSSNPIVILSKKYNLKINDSNVKELAHLVALGNAFIIASAITIVELVSNFILKILVAFIVIVPLILIVYSLIGKHMVKKESK
ncbi:MAG: hypothetical protein E7173_03105 [Firmicutes bacterium]|nr:hypothetical protein [Bacillota bacterium]